MRKLLLIVRHGVASRGPAATADPPLSNLGRSQARALGTRLEDAAIDDCICSPLRRAMETAGEIVAATNRRPSIRMCSDLAEYNTGDLEGYDPSDADSLARFDRYWSDGYWEAWPNGERRVEFRERIQRALREILGETTGTVLVVTHGGVINELLCILLDQVAITPFQSLPCSLNVVQLRNERFCLVSFNDVWHLEDPLSVQLT